MQSPFKTLHSRAQLVLGICGVLLTSSVLITTGRIIGKGNFMLARVAGWCLAAAGLCDIISTAIIVAGVLHIKWLTARPDEELRAWLMRAVAHRNRKTRAYHAALGVVLLSMFCTDGPASGVAGELRGSRDAPLMARNWHRATP